MTALNLFFTALASTVLIMSLTWYFCKKVNNFGFIDAVWSFSFIVHGLIFNFLSGPLSTRKLVLLVMLSAWSFRLGFFLVKRLASHHPQEDTRYVQLRKEYGSNYSFRFFIFFMYQALSVSLLTLPFIFSFNSESSELGLFEFLGLGVWLIALIGESVADAQMNHFRAIPANKGKVCNIGLWNYSRHPNYFFESCIWWGFFIFWMGSTNLLWTIYAPLTILFLLLKVTGVPPSEAQSIKSRGELYKEYQRKTSVFVPWFPKK